MEIDRVQLMNEITKYLDCTGQFNKLKTIVQQFKEEFETQNEKTSLSFRCDVNADFPILVDIAGGVANLLLMEPHLGQYLFNKVINVATKTEDESNLIDQAQSTLQVTLPNLPPISYFSERFTLPYSGLFIIKGVLVARTMPTKYCRSALYRCPLQTCPGHEGQRVNDDQTASTMCSNCGYKTEEFLRARVNGDKVLAVFVCPESFKNTFSRHQGVTICLKDQLTEDLALGVCYNVVASCKSPNFLAWGIERTISEHQWRFSKILPTVGIPPEILKLKEHLQKMCPNSPWALTATLSSQLGSHLYPVKSFFHLKIGLLLSLASQDTDSVPVPLLAVGPDCCSLLQAVSQLAQRRVTVTSPALCGSMAGSVGALWMEAGPLLLATTGVCYAGDWAKFGSGRSSIASQIIAALESGRVDLVASNNSILGSPPNLPLRAAIWTFWSGDKATSTAQAQLRTLIEVFGMPFIGDGSADIEAVAEHLLCEAMQLNVIPPDNLISVEDLQKYLSIVCSYKVSLTAEASRLLRNYFVASRRERPDCLPLSSIKTMTALAEAHARLCLRTCVIYEDVVLVIYLYEEAITALFGPSLMSPPQTGFGGLSIDPNNPSIGQQVSIKLKNFSIWLNQYIKSILSESSVNSSIPEE